MDLRSRGDWASTVDYVLWALATLAAAWIVFLGLARLASFAVAPRPVRADSPTTDLPTEPPPAVVGFLVNGCRVDPDAAVATLIDLAARRHLELYQPANDPDQTLVRVRGPEPEGLTAYEQRVLDRVVTAAGPERMVPLAQLTGGYATDGYRWAAEFEREVRADAKDRKLSTDGPTGVAVLFIVLGFVLACFSGLLLPGLIGGNLLGQSADLGAGTWIGYAIIALVVTSILFVVGLVPIVRWYDRPRRSATGRAVTARWLGVDAWLRGQGSSFAELPPASVAVWDRYLSYGAALGTTPVVSHAADLAVGTREVLWSHHTGSWRRVRVRYQRRGRASSFPPVTVIVNALVMLGIIAALFWYGRTLPPTPALLAAATVGAALALRSLYRLVRATVDWLAPVDITGLVLTRSTLPYLTGMADLEGAPGWRLAKAAMRPERQPYFVVVDDGRADVTIVWTVYPSYLRSGQCQPGDLVHLKGYRWCRFARKITVLPPG